MATTSSGCAAEGAGSASGPAIGERVSAMEGRFDAIIATLATKADLAGIRADIHRWMLATVVGLSLGFGGLFLAMSHALRPSPPPAAAAAPIVISVPAPARPSPVVPPGP